jgi:hypothetical protein
MAELTVRRSGAGATITFEFPEGPAQVLMIAMVEEGAEQPIWWLASDAFTAMFPYTVDSADPEPLESPEEKVVVSALLARGADPAALAAGRKANRPLQSFEYGIVPPGFRQIMPASAPAPLQRGKQYSVTVMGGIGVPVGQASFTA